MYSHACVALEIAYLKLGNLTCATTQAMSADSSSSGALIERKHFQKVLDKPAPEELRVLARNGL